MKVEITNREIIEKVLGASFNNNYLQISSEDGKFIVFMSGLDIPENREAIQTIISKINEDTMKDLQILMIMNRGKK